MKKSWRVETGNEAKGTTRCLESCTAERVRSRFMSLNSDTQELLLFTVVSAVQDHSIPKSHTRLLWKRQSSRVTHHEKKLRSVSWGTRLRSQHRLIAIYVEVDSILVSYLFLNQEHSPMKCSQKLSFQNS